MNGNGEDLRNIAFVGKAGSGKTTAANVLATKHGFLTTSLAAPLKNCAAALGPSFLGDNPRKAWQDLGLHLRKLDEDIFLNAYRDDVGDTTGVVVDDCRFPNEYWALKEMGFFFVRIAAPKHQRIERLMANGKLKDAKDLEHVSETALDNLPVDLIITNGKDEDDFKERVYRNIRVVD